MQGERSAVSLPPLIALRPFDSPSLFSPCPWRQVTRLSLIALSDSRRRRRRSQARAHTQTPPCTPPVPPSSVNAAAPACGPIWPPVPRPASADGRPGPGGSASALCRSPSRAQRAESVLGWPVRRRRRGPTEGAAEQAPPRLPEDCRPLTDRGNGGQNGAPSWPNRCGLPPAIGRQSGLWPVWSNTGQRLTRLPEDCRPL